MTIDAARPGSGISANNDTRPLRLGLLAASPVHYQVPLYRRLAADPLLDFTAIFASTAGVRAHDGGYGQPISWDGDLLGGYQSVFLRRSERQAPGGFLALRDPEIVGLVRRRQFDVLWLQGYNYLTHALAAASQKFAGGALLVRDDQTLLERRPLWKRLVKQVALRALFRDAGGLYIGTENLRWLESYGLPTTRAFFAPYAVENDQLQTMADELRLRRADIRKEFGIRPDGPVVLMVARMIPKKQPQRLLEAYRRVRLDQPCSLVMVGSGELSTSMQAHVARQQIPDVHLLGFRNRTQIAKVYACADVFVLPSGYDETWGMVINEAMNFGLPVVATDKVGSAKDLVRDGQTGYVVAHDSVDAMASKLLLLVASPERRRQFGMAARTHVSGWSYEAAAAGIRKAAYELSRSQRSRPSEASLSK